MRAPDSAAPAQKPVASVVLPTPAGPITDTSVGRQDADARCHSALRIASSKFRPTSAPPAADRSPGATNASIASQLATGRSLPLATTGSAGSYRIAVFVAR